MQKRSKDDQIGAGLVGRYFHVLDERHDVQFQGRVIAQIDGAHYLVQFYEWIMGEANTMHIRTLAQMLEWQFYEDAEHWKFWFEYHGQKRSSRYPTEAEIQQGYQDAGAALAEIEH